jgi:hypothetical protein
VFLGRRVYLAITVVVSAWRLVSTRSPPRRTIARWCSWFEALRDSQWWTVQRGRLWPPVEPTERLPAAIIERLLPNHPMADALAATLRIMTPRPSTG